MSEFSLAEKFPDLRPIKSAPSLSTVNGIGMTLIGHRDYDEETNTYVKTHCFSVLFIPLFSLGAYRVLDSGQGGWYFLGKVPLSQAAKTWNKILLLLIVCVAGFGGWKYYTGTAEYLAEQKMDQAARLVAEGKEGQAARLYQQVLQTPTSQAGVAREKLRGLVQKPPQTVEEAKGVFQVAAEIHRPNDPLLPDLYQHGMRAVEQHEPNNPLGALELLEIVAPLADKQADVIARKRVLLEQVVAKNPQDVGAVSRLAVVYEAEGHPEKCLALLEPVQEKLGTLDGAAVLGHIVADQGKYDQAFQLLKPYVEKRLPEYRTSMQQWKSSLETLQNTINSELNSRKAAGFDYARYETAPAAQKEKMVDEYFDKRFDNDPGLRKAQQKLQSESRVFEAILDFGIVQLHRGQAANDPAVRKAELENAEKTFLSIQSIAGRNEKYQLGLGQVYYWLGKHTEGRKVFDDMLKSSNRNADQLVEIAHMLREVGDVSDARTFLEEAYAKLTDKKKKYNAANLRSVMFKDLEDKIVWLGRSDPDEPQVKALLATASASKAMQQGNDAEAERHMRDAINTYAAISENASTLNNAALVHFGLYHLTHAPEEFTRGIDKLDRAIALQPSDTILLSNSATEVWDSAIRDVLGNAVDFKLLKRGHSGTELLRFLYDDAEGAKAISEKLRKHPATIKARGYLEKLMILSPKGSLAYVNLYDMYSSLSDVDGMRSVLERLGKTELDLKESNQIVIDAWKGKNLDKYLPDLRTGLARSEEVLGAARRKGGITFAVAVDQLIRLKLIGMSYDLPLEPDALVSLAEEAYTTSPSFGTRTTLLNALEIRAHRTLIKQNARYAEFAQPTKLSISNELLTYVLSRPGELRDTALANADVKRMNQLRLEKFKKFSDDVGYGTWAAVQAFDPKQGEEIAKAIRANPIIDIGSKVVHAISPVSGRVALNDYYGKLFDGNQSEADEVLKKYAATGMPLPLPKNKANK